MQNNVYLSTAYFPPIQYMSKLLQAKHVFIEAHEHYEKQSYRNRCRISGPNGIQSLSVPVISGRSPGQDICSVRIDYSESWQGVHRRSIETAYAAAPFFDFYYDDIRQLFTRKPVFLFDLNMKILNTLIRLLDDTKNPALTQNWKKSPKGDDFRNKIHPKPQKSGNDKGFHPETYMQVFSERFGFIPNLSTLDLLFNEGPVSRQYLLKV
ncbi:MAG TPA: WbqC family protein [Bacteroidales bacterium]|nr:WbqC family protein [Bacteroidales bacterium]